MTAVVAVGFGSGQFLEGVRPVPAFPESLERAHLDGLLDVVADGLAARGSVLVVYPAWHAEPALRRIQTVRAALDTLAVVGYGSAAGPLAGAVLAVLAAAVAPAAGAAGVLHAAVPALERQLVGVTWLARVNGLTSPVPTLRDHALSWWPGAAFAVTTWPEPRVSRLRREATGTWQPVTLPRPAAAVALAVADAGGDPEWVRRVVVPALGGPPVVPVAPSPLAAARWGRTPATEAVAYPTDVAALAAAVLDGLRRGRCPWCGETAAAPRCPSCGLDAEPARTEAALAPRAAAAGSAHPNSHSGGAA